MAEQFLHRADVVAVLQQVGREAVAEGVATRRLFDVCGTNGLLDRALNRLRMKVKSTVLS